MLMKELHDHYGTWTKLCIELGLGMSAHQYWRKKGYIPYTAQLIIEKKTNGLFKAELEHARPTGE